MLNNFKIAPTGNEAVDTLREIQAKVDQIAGREEKKMYLLAVIEDVPIEELFDEVFKVDTLTVIGTLPAKEKPRRFIFNESMEFIGRAAAYSYYVNPAEFIDSISIRFVDPVVLQPDVMAADYSLFQFEVPVLAIDALQASR